VDRLEDQRVFQLPTSAGRRYSLAARHRTALADLLDDEQFVDRDHGVYWRSGGRALPAD